MSDSNSSSTANPAGGPLFQVPIPASGPHTGGSIVCTEPEKAVYLLTFTSPPDNRLTTAFCEAMLTALDRIEFGGYPPGVVVTTSGIPKFYSNGLDLQQAVSVPGYWANSLYKLFKRFLTYPLPTIALINGHAFAGGLMLAMHHDYRVMNPERGFVCLNELEFGAPLKPPMSSIFRLKLPAPSAYRALILEAHRFPAREAVTAGLVDVVGGMPELLRFLVAEKRLREKGTTGVYGALKAEMYRESVALLTPEGHEREEEREKRMVAEEQERTEAGRRRAAEQFGLKGKL